ncbi:helix-turn-helix domain-containing protein [Kaistia terrae]|uniref:Helix-turn-helix domain-containing protein n=1 Tax=Kaistia terrae TaxID=537017 RepID=A0ABW0Q314_9HYPH|nr:helix-turn-helix domain-containing protein [Kaistia terrae]MCX5581468.1 hypothetical protein [Kaistia terrae]
MNMTESMARVERMALRGLDIDQIMATGLPLSARTVASIVHVTRAARPKAVVPPPEAVEAKADVGPGSQSVDRADAIARYRIIDVRLGGVRRSIGDIIRETAAKHLLVSADLVGRSRQRTTVVPARHEAMYLCAKATPYSMPEIGRSFGRDHTTVIYGIQQHAKRNGLPLPRGMKPEGATA